MTEPYLQRGEVLMTRETLYFQPRKIPRTICDPASSNHHNSGVLHSKNNISGDITAKACRKPQYQFGVSSLRRLGIRRVIIWEALFF